MKKLLYIFFLFFICSCNLFIGLPLNENIIVLKEEPILLSIDDFDNGIIRYKNEIFRINNLNINYSKINLNDKDTEYPLYQAYYSSNKKGDFIIVYSRDTHYDEVQIAVANIPPLKYPFYVIKILKNEKRETKKEKMFEGNVNNLKTFLYDNNYSIYKLNKKRANLLDSEIINYENNEVKSNDLKEAVFGTDNFNTNIILNENGSGWFYSSYLETIDKKVSRLFSLKDYNKEEEKLKDEIEDKNFTLYDIYLDYQGKGFILFKSIDNKNIYKQEFYNFSKKSEKELIFENKNEKPLNNRYNTQIKDIIINEEGTGIFFVKNLKNEQVYLKKITNFKLENKEINIINSDSYKMYSYSINKKGNGFIVMENGKSFIAKKLRNYEIEK